MKNRKDKGICTRHKPSVSITNTTAGITLVALVITVIVLLILAGVTINLVVGDNGIIGKAKNAKENMTNAQGEENEQLRNLQNYMEELGGVTNSNDPETGTVPEGIPLPEGFYHVGGDLETGYVISDNQADEGKGTSHEVALNLVGNQFVWIPVEVPVASSEAELTTMLAEGKLPMAVKQEDGYYRGVLYDVGTDSNGKATFTAKSYTLNTDYREPETITGDGTKYDAAEANLAKAGVSDLETFKTQLKNEYKSMVESVIKNKGFYVARYEPSKTADNKVESKANVNVMTAARASGDTWYGMYAKCKNLSSNKTSVTTGMIWGSQWDQMMIYLKDVPNLKDPTKLFILDSTEMGNYTGSEAKTGSNSNYQIKGIYDIAGNLFDWTMEAQSSSSRNARGGNYGQTGKEFPVSIRSGSMSTLIFTGTSVRFMLYGNS